MDCERFGAQGITVHPRPDGRHIRYEDVLNLKKVVRTEFNIEGFPSKSFVELVLNVKPEQVTLVPDAPEAVTSNAGWDTLKNQSFLTEVVSEFKRNKIRTSLFIETDSLMIEGAAKTNAERIELYTETYATHYSADREKAINPFIHASSLARQMGLGINAGHDLNLENLHFLVNNIPEISEVSIGHALISDSLYFGLENTIQLYLRQLQ